MKRVNIILFGAIFLLIQGAVFISYSKSSETVDLRCSSTFTRNAYEDYSFFFKGNFIVDLKKNGTGELTIRAYTDGQKPMQVIRTYSFEYKLDRNGQFFNRLLKEKRGASDNVDNVFYKKYFFDLDFDSGGQIRMRYFNNTILFMTQDMLLSACSPLS